MGEATGETCRRVCLRCYQAGRLVDVAFSEATCGDCDRVHCATHGEVGRWGVWSTEHRRIEYAASVNRIFELADPLAEDDTPELAPGREKKRDMARHKIAAWRHRERRKREAYRRGKRGRPEVLGPTRNDWIAGLLDGGHHDQAQREYQWGRA